MRQISAISEKIMKHQAQGGENAEDFEEEEDVGEAADFQSSLKDNEGS